MEKIYEKMSEKYRVMLDTLKDAICEHMKELGKIQFNTKRDFPFMDEDGWFVSPMVSEMEYTEEGDVVARSKYGDEYSVQLSGTVDGCLELLYYLEEEAYVKL